MGNIMEKGNWENRWMGGMAIDECEDKQIMSFIVQTSCKYFQGRYGRL
jgi:hypothetical protein